MVMMFSPNTTLLLKIACAPFVLIVCVQSHFLPVHKWHSPIAAKGLWDWNSHLHLSSPFHHLGSYLISPYHHLPTPYHHLAPFYHHLAYPYSSFGYFHHHKASKKEEGKTEESPASDTTPCSPNPCQKDGNCRTVNATFECQCPPGWGGDTCDNAEPFCPPFFFPVIEGGKLTNDQCLGTCKAWDHSWSCISGAQVGKSGIAIEGNDELVITRNPVNSSDHKNVEVCQAECKNAENKIYTSIDVTDETCICSTKSPGAIGVSVAEVPDSSLCLRECLDFKPATISVEPAKSEFVKNSKVKFTCGIPDAGPKMYVMTTGAPTFGIIIQTSSGNIEDTTWTTRERTLAQVGPQKFRCGGTIGTQVYLSEIITILVNEPF